MESVIFPGDRVKLLHESDTYGTVWSVPTGDTVAVRLDDGRAVHVDTSEVAHLR
ncbi:hypothetical protein [Tsukamurella soli]|uniref:DUF1918 domain-containing protein n=1 Tax=Tsukamurella soli TaxID=644556 RepID=A0ABP8JGZ7_9ACTN